MNREDAPHLSDDRFNDLILALGTLREAIKNLNEKNERLVSGPGGIMEMKQTIADKEQRIEELESRFFMVNQFKLYFHAFNKAADRIEKLETALEHTMECFLGAREALKECVIERDEARKALEGKEPLEWTENYGQGSEPWLKDVK